MVDTPPPKNLRIVQPLVRARQWFACHERLGAPQRMAGGRPMRSRIPDAQPRQSGGTGLAVSDPAVRLDEIDLKLIELLQADGRTSNSRLARALGVTEATVRRRIAQLEDSRVMRVVAVTDTE